MSFKWVLVIKEPNKPKRFHAKLVKDKNKAVDMAIELSIKHPTWSIVVERFDPNTMDLSNQNYQFVARKEKLRAKNRSMPK